LITSQVKPKNRYIDEFLMGIIEILKIDIEDISICQAEKFDFSKGKGSPIKG